MVFMATNTLKICCSKYEKHTKLKSIKVLYNWNITVISSFCNKCDNQNNEIFKNEEIVEILKYPGLIDNIKYHI